MESKVKLLGHPVHQILVAFPIGLLGTAALFDAVYVVRGTTIWATVAFYIMGAGVVSGAVAAPFGLVDFIAIPSGTRAKRIGAFHGLGSLTVVLLFGISWVLQLKTVGLPVALLFAFAGAACLALAGWLGGELLNRMGVGIDDGAHLDASSSLAGHVASTAGKVSHGSTGPTRAISDDPVSQ